MDTIPYMQFVRLFESERDFCSQDFGFLKSDTILVCAIYIGKCHISVGFQYVFDTVTTLTLKCWAS